ncbi:MAG: hypothetical protein JNN03_12955 [Rubrivivax sp.]|nr:hypothetical protein [Rubrivivax sp.]
MIRPIPTHRAWHRRVLADAMTYWQERSTRRALHELDRRTLADIGVDASELTSIAAESSTHAQLTRLRIVAAGSHA